VDVSGAKLSRPFLLQGVERYGEQHPDPQRPCSWGRFESQGQPHPLREGAEITYVSLRGPSFCCLCQFLFPNAFVLLRRVSSVLTVLHGEARSKPCLQRAAVGTEREKTGPKCRLDGSEGKGEDTPSMPKTLKEKKEEGK
jgi:hypothetical protein